MKFQDYVYTRPDVDAVLADIRHTVEVMENAASAEAQLKAFHEHEERMQEFNSLHAIANIRHDIDTRDAFYAEEKAFFNEKMPLIQNELSRLSKAMSGSPFRKELEEALGAFTMEKIDYQVKGMCAEIIPLMQKENRLTTRYFQLYSSAQIPFAGKTLTVEQMPPYKAAEDRAVRRAAYVAEGEFFDSIGEELDQIYDRLVHNRNEQARIMGYKDYTELAVIRMRRYGYGPKEIKAFREQVANDLVPLVTEIKKLQAKRIGVCDWKAYDNLTMFPDGNPAPKGTPEELIKAAQEMYRRLSPETAEFFDFMVDNGLLEVESKPGKAPGGYCSSIQKYKAPFIFSNFNGGAGDVEVLTHEAGHAFEGYTAYRDPAFEGNSYLRRYSSETAECHSMGMEFLTAQFHELLLKEDTPKYELQHAENALSFIPYACIIDAFQYEAYEHPDLTPEERHQIWKRLLERFQPHLTDYEDIPFYSRYAGWQYKLHVFMNPLYYIDYALAQTVALQFFMLSLENPEEAWEKYMKLIRSAGTRRFADTVKYVGLDSPFEEGTVKKVAEKVAAWIHENQL